MKIYKVKVNGKLYEVELEAVSETTESIKEDTKKEEPESRELNKILAPIAGKVVDVKVEVGDKVSKGQVVDFGEHKKGTLTIAWAIANRNGYASCHGGQKEYTLKDGTKFVASVYGLSGSGKSTITHAKHDGKYGVKVLHDDAFIINSDTCASIALEPTYFDKTADYPTGCAFYVK